MSKILEAKYDSELIYRVDYLVENDEFKPWKDRIVSQFVNNVEVPGFRKGKAPLEMAMKQLDLNKVQTTLVMETIQKYFEEVQKAAKTELDKDNRQALTYQAVLDQEFTKETEEGFVFRIVVNILPQVDLEPINSIVIQAPTEADIPARMSLAEFIEKEKQGYLLNYNTFEIKDQAAKSDSRLVVDLSEGTKGQAGSTHTDKKVTIALGYKQYLPEFETQLVGIKAGETRKFEVSLINETTKKEEVMEYEVTCHEVLESKFHTLKEVIENNTNGNFKNVEELEMFLHNFYSQETNAILQDLARKSVINKVLEVVEDFEIDSQKVTTEVERIYATVENESKKAEVSLGEVFTGTGLPGSEKVVSDDKVRPLIEVYVKNEFKLVGILQVIYYTKIEDKIKEEDVKQAAKEIQKDPVKYNVKKDIKENEAQEIAFDRMLRNLSYNWIVGQIKIEESEEVIEDGVTTLEVEEKKPTAKTDKKEVKTKETAKTEVAKKNEESTPSKEEIKADTKGVEEVKEPKKAKAKKAEKK